jgi:hypothetical protein
MAFFLTAINRNILIEGNTFEGYGNLGGVSLAGKQGTAVLIRNADSVIVRDNMFGPPSPTVPRGVKPLLIEVSRNVVVKDNQGLPEAAQPEGGKAHGRLCVDRIAFDSRGEVVPFKPSGEDGVIVNPHP